MKKLLSTFMFLLLLQQSFFGQSTPAGGNAIPNIIPPTPEAYAISKFGGNTIGLVTGTTTYSVPLYTIKVGDYSLPLSVSYSSNGVKVDEVASRVGMQWKMDFESIISRTVIGGADETYGFRAPTNNVASDSFYNFLRVVATNGNGLLFKPDQYNYSIPGYSGRFIIDSGRVIQIPYNNLKIEKSLYSFTITTTDGAVYTFGGGYFDQSVTNPGGGDGTCYPETLEGPTITGYYLTSIRLANGDSIKYVYEGIDASYLSGVNQTYNFIKESALSGISFLTNTYLSPSSIKTCFQRNDYSGFILKEIRFPTGKVAFFYSSREDVIGEKKLDSLQVVNQNQEVIKRYRFNYQYSYNASTAFDSKIYGYTDIQVQYPELRKRLFLNGVDDYSPSAVQSYKFGYIDFDSLPPRLSYAQDYWGYFNGISNNFLFPAYTYAGLFTKDGIELGADRRGHFESSQKGMLKKISYPTGGFTDYAYEPSAIASYMKWRPIYDTLRFVDSVTAVNNLYVSDTFSMNGGVLKLSLASTAAPLNINSDPNGNQGIYPDTLIYITIKDISNNIVFEDNMTVWQSRQYNYYNLPSTGVYRLYVQSTYPPSVHFSITIYDPHPSVPALELPMGGVRVKSLQDNDGMGHIQNKKEFTYLFEANTPWDVLENNPDDDENGLFYSVLRGVDKSLSGPNPPYNDVEYAIYQITSNSTYPLYVNDYSAVSYPKVTEQWLDASGNITGGIDHEFLVKKKTLPFTFEHFAVGTRAYPFVPNIIPGAQSSNDALHNGAELKTNMFKVVNSARQYTSKTTNVYSIEPATKFADTLYDIRYQLDWSQRIPAWNYFNDFDVNRYIIYSDWQHLDSAINKTYTDAGDSISTFQAFTYSDTSHMQVTSVSSVNSKGEQIKTTNKYPADFSGSSPYTEMLSRHIITPVIDQVQKNITLNKELSHSKTNYSLWQNGAFIKPSSVQKSIMGAALQTEVTLNKYDVQANIHQFTARDGVINSFIWDYHGDYPIAKATNADSASIAYTSFEADGSGNWSIGSTSRDSTTAAITGRKSYNIGNGNLSKSGLTSGKNYIISYWSRSGVKSISGGSGSSRSGRTVNGWTYYEHAVMASSSTITVSGSGLIDEIRLFPQKAQMATYTYTPLIGTTSISDANGEISYYEYDGFSRLKNIKDYQGNIVKNFQYNYANSCGNNCVVLPMQTFTGTNTISYPVGVFSVNGKLLGNASNQSQYISLWMNDTANSHTGTITSSIDSMHFNFTVNSGRLVPPSVIGCRYYQYDFTDISLNAVRNSNGCYVDFGDGSSMQLGKTISDTPAILAPNTTMYTVNIGNPDTVWENYYVHTYPNKTSKVLTFYHNDGSETPTWKPYNYNSPIDSLKNIRGDFPESMQWYENTYVSHPTVKSIFGISNWNKITTITLFSAGLFNSNFPQDFMEANRNLQKIYLTDTFNISLLKSDWNTYFVNLQRLYIENRNWNRENISSLTQLNSLFILSSDWAYPDITSSEIDAILNQLVSGAGQSVQNGYAYISTKGSQRTSASDAAVNFLKSKGWIIITGSVQQ